MELGARQNTEIQEIGKRYDSDRAIDNIHNGTPSFQFPASIVCFPESSMSQVLKGAIE